MYNSGTQWTHCHITIDDDDDDDDNNDDVNDSNLLLKFRQALW